MNNIMLPAPHKILKVVKETRAEYTFRVAYEGETRHGQFFQLSIPKVGEAPISVSGKGEGWVEFTIRKVGRLTEGIFGLGAAFKRAWSPLISPPSPLRALRIITWSSWARR